LPGFENLASLIFVGVSGCQVNKKGALPLASVHLRLITAMKIKTIFGLWILFFLAAGFRAAAQSTSGSVMEVATSTPELSTWVKAVRAAGLEKNLNGPGPFTVFAPSNVAFSNLLPGALDELLKPENKQRLIDILNVHLVQRNLPSSQLAGEKQVSSLGGKALRVAPDGNSLRVSDALVSKADIPASNGTIHIIDKVIMP
jgi:uncharacterized surface protein with fasciclin (FAS1) repeats